MTLKYPELAFVLSPGFQSEIVTPSNAKVKVVFIFAVIAEPDKKTTLNDILLVVLAE